MKLVGVCSWCMCVIWVCVILPLLMSYPVAVWIGRYVAVHIQGVCVVCKMHFEAHPPGNLLGLCLYSIAGMSSPAMGANCDYTSADLPIVYPHAINRAAAEEKMDFVQRPSLWCRNNQNRQLQYKS